jgi:hypothetical protein
MVAKYFKEIGLSKELIFDESLGDEIKDVVHHADNDRYNNNPENLAWMSWSDHSRYHAHHGFDSESQRLGTLAAAEKLRELQKDPIAWENHLKSRLVSLKETVGQRTDADREQIGQNISAGILDYFDSLSDEERIIRNGISTNNVKKANEVLQKLLKEDDEFREFFTSRQREGWSEFKNTEQYKIRGANTAERNRKNYQDIEYKEMVFGNQRVKYSKQMMDWVQNLARGKTTHQMTRLEIVEAFNADSEILNHFLEINSDTCCANWDKKGITDSQMRTLPTKFGYKNWKHFRQDVEEYNHSIVSIEWLVEPIEVGTLTIDGDEIYHNYHNFALAVGVFTNNSNLNEIDDLRYFNNRLARGLRVPSSYLPTGPEDNPTPLSDGRVGTAMIQEFRFNKYCERLQGYISRKLNEEFKMFMRWRGLNIDSALFDIKFNPPQNFAAYRQAEIDTARVSTFTSMVALPYMSTRFSMERFLGLSQEEIKKNEKLWREEREEPEDQGAKGNDLRNVGVSLADIEGDLETADNMENNPEGEQGMSPEVTAPVTPAGGAGGTAAGAPPPV